MHKQISADQETLLVERAREGDATALNALVEPLRKPLFSYIYRLVAKQQDAEDLLQDVLVRVLQSLPGFRGDARFKTWLFGIATHTCLDYLRRKKRWRIEAQLEGEREVDEHPEQLDRLADEMSRPDFVFEIREHIAFCFSCVSRTLPPEEQAALMLREVLGFSNSEAAGMMEVSEPIFRHRLSSARSKMIQSYDGLCQLINKTGVCYQCRGLREFAPKHKQGPDLVQIEVAQGMNVTPENLFNARLKIVREGDLTEGPMRSLHDWLFENISKREEDRT